MITDDFWTDGVAVVREVLTESQICAARRQVDRYLADATAAITEVTAESAESGRYAYGHGVLQHAEVMRSVLRRSCLVPEITRLLGARSPLTLLDDQVYVKEPGATQPTPWHQDASYWATSGRELCSAWLALDEAEQASGGLQFVLGSHAWGAVFRAQAFVDGQDVGDPQHRRMPTDGELRDHHVWAPKLAPGDAVVFHALTLHCAGPNQSSHRRRAVVTRWAGPDVRYAPRAFASQRQMDKAERNHVVAGERFVGAGYLVFGGANE